MHFFVQWAAVAVVAGVALSVSAASVDDSTTVAAAGSEQGLKEDTFPLERRARESWDWSVQAGFAIISGNNIGEIFSGDFNRARGDAGGCVYSLSVNWVAHRFEIPLRERMLRPRFEPYATVAVVDEEGGALFPDFNGGVGIRWVDFPWDRWIETTVFIGIGLSYSTQVYAIDRERHDGEDRSHLKFDWPIQVTFAIPRWPRHQLVLFNDHHSGGHVFDEGGVNSVGIGYRFEF
jgi:hypothetical protein